MSPFNSYVCWDKGDRAEGTGGSFPNYSFIRTNHSSVLPLNHYRWQRPQIPRLFEHKINYRTVMNTFTFL